MKLKFTLTLALLFCFLSNANNITVSNISLENLNEPEWVQIEFDLSWENSWRLSAGPSNWDAAWVFIKYRVNSGDWQHAQLAQTDFVAASGSTIDITEDGVGAFIYRDSDGSGDLDLQGIRLRWDYGSIDPNDIIDIQVFALEMVYVPEGPFSLGSPGTEVGKFYSWTTNNPYRVESENAITVNGGLGNLYYNNPAGGSNPGDQLSPIPAAFPKGYQSFYCMKYEMTQGQYVSFFNTLTPAQKIENDITGASGKNQDTEVYRNTIAWEEGSTTATTTSPDLPLNYVNNYILYAYLDWSGLRPMTELEYEKSCRGPITPKADEFAWGNSNIADTAYNIVNISQPNELVTNPAVNTGNAHYSSTNGTTSGPKRVGALAASALNKTREETGGSYYGIMELTGNLYERCITVGNPEGRAFTSVHGDGEILVNGLANVTSWPTDNTGIGYRGGSSFNGIAIIRVSDRYDAASSLTGSNNRLGFRGVRTED
ncbi:SUMF1/EgtB/PvdO family nonheme iron enzyme [Algibacter pectinivorans]|uniref:Formylglycine-generating enzyme, required for sulfatase activity, contains SUMF1/FGE domain n=1 Tax=Algibacter pectinivorans TaxID=870482 RepID=A0A1I1RVW6_9FLAO|nr:SUMF1/EgtB/PvdO family nonheme iron enzyme [Algibacter pectinivorans]SFD38391.1 Formylglycine-generating enzyme, required for sulfatase activity, contains SUMF1/FGE domain [Algibacter pectinivorans]